MKNFIAITMTVFTLFSFSSYADHVVKTFKSEQIKKLSLKNTSGNSLVVGRKISEVKVNVERITWNDRCKLEVIQKSETLSVFVQKKTPGFSFSSSSECRANINITLPLEADAEIKSGSGDIFITDLTGKIDVKTGSGNLKIEKPQITKLLARSGSGDLNILGEISDADIKVGSGNINFVYQKTPSTGNMIIKSGSGDVNLSMPKESKVNVAFEAGSGQLSNELGNLQNAKYRISMKTGSGNLNVKKL